ncbi:MAG: hypothetical protein AAGF97_13440, partial [Planctomycetota bacterium]
SSGTWSCSGVVLEVRNSGGGVIATSDRGGRAVEEALQITAPGGDLDFRVILTQGVGSADGDTYLLEVLSRTN